MQDHASDDMLAEKAKEFISMAEEFRAGDKVDVKTSFGWKPGTVERTAGPDEYSAMFVGPAGSPDKFAWRSRGVVSSKMLRPRSLPLPPGVNEL